MPSGPRWEMTPVILSIRPGSIGAPSKRMMPAMPLMRTASSGRDGRVKRGVRVAEGFSLREGDAVVLDPCVGGEAAVRFRHADADLGSEPAAPQLMNEHDRTGETARAKRIPVGRGVNDTRDGLRLCETAAATPRRRCEVKRSPRALDLAPAPESYRRGLAEAQAVARIVHAAANRNPLRPSCLARSVVLVHQLRRRGLAAEIRIGVAKPDGCFAAHAWVEHDGVALAETEASRDAYAPLDAAVPAR